MAVEFSGEQRIAATQQRVWAALNDPLMLKASIPGCKELDRLSDTEFGAIVVARVGPIAATFRGNVELSELDPPNAYTLTGRGQGGAAGFAKMTAHVKLHEEEGQTVLSYQASADIGGKLASVGSRLIQSVAQKTADDFFAAFAQQLGGGAVQALARNELSPPSSQTPAGGMGAPVPAWLVVFGTGLGLALGYCLALLR